MLPRTRLLIVAKMTETSLQRSGIIEATTWEGTTMPIALRLNVQAHEGTLMLTDRAGKTVTFSKEHTVQQQVSRITLGEFCGLPKRHLATCFGFQTRTSSDALRHTVLHGSPVDLLPTRRRNAPRRLRPSSSARVARPIAIGMRSPRHFPRRDARSAPDASDRSWPTRAGPKKTEATHAPPGAAPRQRRAGPPRWALPAARPCRHPPRPRA